jgi:TolA-binding protein
MDSLPLLWIVLAAAAGALVGAMLCWVPMSRAATALRERVERAEQARNGAVERSAQAREQIAQLNKAITEMRRTHSARSSGEAAAPSTEERRAAAEKALDEARQDEATLVMPRHQPLQVFADTEVLNSKV